MNVCGDNSCFFGRPEGVGTNGGCRCLDRVKNEIGKGQWTIKVELEIHKLTRKNRRLITGTKDALQAEYDSGSVVAIREILKASLHDIGEKADLEN